MRYMIIIEAGENSFGAYVPDLPGCVAVGETEEEVRQLIHEAIEFHLEDLRESGTDIPEPSSKSEYVEVFSRVTIL
jgi:predicted RNase H-like HicB family nuclease